MGAKVGGVRRRLRLWSPVLAYGRLWSAMVWSVLHGEVQSQVVKSIVMVGSRWCWVVDGGAVLLGNGIAGFHGGAVLLGIPLVGGQTHCKGGFQKATGCRWCRCVIREFTRKLVISKEKWPESRDFHRKSDQTVEISLGKWSESDRK